MGISNSRGTNDISYSIYSCKSNGRSLLDLAWVDLDEPAGKLEFALQVHLELSPLLPILNKKKKQKSNHNYLSSMGQALRDDGQSNAFSTTNDGVSVKPNGHYKYNPRN